MQKLRINMNNIEEDKPAIQGKISVVVPAYNAETTLQRSIESILNQSYSNIEIIIVDDGSEDQTREVAQTLREKDDRIRIIHQTNSGVSAARNKGLETATGEYITFLDADDYMESEVYEKMVAEMERDRLDIVSAAIKEVYNGDVIKIRNNPDNCPVISGIRALCNMFSYQGGIRTVVWDKLYRKECVKEIRFDINYKFGEDTLFNCQAMLECKRYGQISYVGYTYDHRESKATGQRYNRDSMCNVSVIEDMQELVDISSVSKMDIVKEYLMRYRITIYRQLFQSLLRDYSDIYIDDYLYLKRCASKLKIRDLFQHLSLKHLIQWYIYCYFFGWYRQFYSIWK